MAPKLLFLMFAALVTVRAGIIDRGKVTVESIGLKVRTEFGSSGGDYFILNGSDGFMTFPFVKIGDTIQVRTGTDFENPNASFIVGGVPKVGVMRSPGGFSTMFGRNSRYRLRTEPFVVSASLIQTARFEVVSAESFLYGTIDGVVPEILFTDIGVQGTGTVTFEYFNPFGTDAMNHVRSTWVFDTPEPTTTVTTAFGALAVLAARRRRMRGEAGV